MAIIPALLCGLAIAGAIYPSPRGPTPFADAVLFGTAAFMALYSIIIAIEKDRP